MITIFDVYEGSEVLYCGGSIRDAKRAIRQRIEDTSGECTIDYTIDDTPFEKEVWGTVLSEYIEKVEDEVFGEV